MTTNSIDLTGLTPQQINKIREIVEEFRNNSDQSQEELISDDQFLDDEELEQLHDEFDWLVADLGIKTPLTRSQIYDS
jgi:hypothetical protein